MPALELIAPNINDRQRDILSSHVLEVGRLHVLGYSYIKPIDELHWAGLFQFAFTWAIIVGRFDDMSCYLDRWCYHDFDHAKQSLLAWNGAKEPGGWHRHPVTGRRRENGDASKEYVCL